MKLVKFLELLKFVGITLSSRASSITFCIVCFKECNTLDMVITEQLCATVCTYVDHNNNNTIIPPYILPV